MTTEMGEGKLINLRDLTFTMSPHDKNGRHALLQLTIAKWVGCY